MLVDIELGQGSDIDLKFALPGQTVGQLIIEAVDSLDNQNIVLSHGQVIAVVFLLSAFKIEIRKFYSLSFQQIAHLAVK